MLALAVVMLSIAGSGWGATIVEGPVTIEGIVVAAGTDGAGWVIEVAPEETVTVYGIGPEWYWASLGTSRPEVGEFVSIEAYLVQFADGSTKYIAVSVTVGDTTVVLRDLESDGLPLWRKGGPTLKAFALHYYGMPCGSCCCDGDPDQLRLQDQDRDRLHDGSCLLE
jgi:hypothetical protein